MKSHQTFFKSRLFIYQMFIILSSFLAVGNLTGCSAMKSLMGEVKPVDNRAEAVIPDLSKNHPKWKKISVAADAPDAAWQSEETASVISIDSACRENLDAGTDLKEITTNLLSQWGDLKILNEAHLTVSGFPALETTAQGLYLKRQRRFQTVTVKSPHCIYDLIFLGPVQTFDQDLSVFMQFRDSLILK